MAMPSAALNATAAAAGIALINSFGNLGGFFSPTLIGLISPENGESRDGTVGHDRGNGCGAGIISSADPCSRHGCREKKWHRAGSGDNHSFDHSGSKNELPIRPRRLRRTDPIRRMVRETMLTPDSFIYPLFVHAGVGGSRNRLHAWCTSFAVANW